jgi:ATP/maltotriose-dependent transcriptional regulator MalT
VVLPYLGGLHAQAGRLARARELVEEAETVCTELGATHSSVIHSGTVRADIELLAGDFPAAERTLREQCEFLQQMHDRSHLAVRAAKLAEAMIGQGDLDEAERWMAVSRANAALDDRTVQLIVGPVEAKLLAERGALDQARARAEEIVRLADRTDGLNQIAAARLALAEVQRSAGRMAEALRAVEHAIEIFDRKGNSVGATGARQLLELVSQA